VKQQLNSTAAAAAVAAAASNGSCGSPYIGKCHCAYIFCEEDINKINCPHFKFDQPAMVFFLPTSVPRTVTFLMSFI
jgi:hypothetical protein